MRAIQRNRFELVTFIRLRIRRDFVFFLDLHGNAFSHFHRFIFKCQISFPVIYVSVAIHRCQELQSITRITILEFQKNNKYGMATEI